MHFLDPLKLHLVVMYLLQLGGHQMRRYVGEWGKRRCYTGHREAWMTKRVGETTMMTPSMMSSSSTSRFAM